MSIVSLQNSLEIYEVKKNMAEINQNHYGMGLANYALGYVYEKYAEYLTKDNPKFGIDRCVPGHEKYLAQSITDSHTKACKFFKKAFKEFE